MLFKRISPRQFSYQPRWYKPANEKKGIQFQSIGYYDARRNARKPIGMLLLLFIVFFILYYLGGVRHSVDELEIRLEDAVAESPDTVQIRSLEH